jgi:hypothetical protein
MNRPEKSKREKCDCDVNTELLTHAREQLKTGNRWCYTPWDKNGGYLWCPKHRVYVRIAWEVA